MPSKSTMKRAKEDLREGKAVTTAAGEFVHEEIEHVRHGKHGALSPQQAIAIGLNKARRAGIPLPPPGRGRAKQKTRESAESAYRKGRSGTKPAKKRSQPREAALKKESRSSVSHKALSKHARAVARRRKPAGRAHEARRAA